MNVSRQPRSLYRYCHRKTRRSHIGSEDSPFSAPLTSLCLLLLLLGSAMSLTLPTPIELNVSVPNAGLPEHQCVNDQSWRGDSFHPDACRAAWEYAQEIEGSRINQKFEFLSNGELPLTRYQGMETPRRYNMRTSVDTQAGWRMYLANIPVGRRLHSGDRDAQFLQSARLARPTCQPPSIRQERDDIQENFPCWTICI